MFWTVDKLDLRIKELRGLRYRDVVKLKEWSFKIDTEHRIGAYPPSEPGEQTINEGDRWQGRDLYVWLGRPVQIPAEWSGRKVAGLFDFGKTGGGHNSGFESLLFVNGKPYQGVDSNHMEVFLPEGMAGQSVELSFRLWSGLEGGGKPTEQEHQFKVCELAWLDSSADNLYYTARAVLESVKILSADRVERQQLIKALDRAFKALNWSRPGSEDFYASVVAAETILSNELEILEQTHPVTVHCIGHTHIDVAWLWRLAHTREKSARSFSTVLRLMEQYPEYLFLQTQPQLYAYIKEDYPEIYEQIKQRVAEGRWEAGGAMWLEADCNLTSGESLVRQILYGTQFFREEFGVECKYLWLPDVFGYSWALPQILRKSGIDTFMTTKISWNQYNRMPNDTFKWRGIDGSEVLTHFITTPEAAGSDGWWYTYNGQTEPFAVKGIWDSYRDKNINRDLLLSYGYGDGGGGVNRDMLEMRRRLEHMPGIPQAVPGRVDEYFEQLQQTVAATDQYVHTWDGELYLEYHRGTYTSQAHNKRMNRKLELLFRETEWLQVIHAVESRDWSVYPQEHLLEDWRTLLRNQFHDIIPGSSIAEVYADSKLEYEQVERSLKGLWSEAAAGLAAKAIAGWTEAATGPVEAESAAGTEAAAAVTAPATAAAAATSALETTPESTFGETQVITVYNSASFERNDTIYIEGYETAGQGVWVNEQGQEMAAQPAAGGWSVRVEQVPALGSSQLRYRTAAEPAAVPTAEPTATAKPGVKPTETFNLLESGLSTPWYELSWNAEGQLTSVFDKTEKRQVLADGERGNVLQVFEDKPKMFEAWDIDSFYQEKMTEVRTLTSAVPIAQGPLYATIRFTWAYAESTIIQDMTVYRDSRRIDFSTTVDWHEQQQLLKVAFPVSVRSTEATYDIQFGNVKRPTHWNTSWDFARFETVGHQWVDLSERGYGVSLLNDCKYGHDIKDHVIRLSLLKSATYPDPGADQGEHVFTYSLLPHAGDWLQANTVQEAWQLNHPLTWSAGVSKAAGKSLFSVDQASVLVDAVKKAEGGNYAVIRLHEYTGARCEVTLRSDFRITSWQECDLLERPLADEQSGAEIVFTVKPYEIKTFLVHLE